MISNDRKEDLFVWRSLTCVSNFPRNLNSPGAGEERQSEEFSDARETTKATQIDYIYENI